MVIWDIESDGANTAFSSIIELGAIWVDKDFKEKDRFGGWLLQSFEQRIGCRRVEGLCLMHNDGTNWRFDRRVA